MKKRELDIASRRSCTEDGVAENEWTVTLKDGTKVDGREAQSELICIGIEIDSDPELVDRIREHAAGRCDCPQNVRDKLEGSYFVKGELRPVVKAILLNGVERTSQGLRVADPYLHCPETDHVLNTMAENQPIHVERLRREIEAAQDPDSPDLSR